MLNYMAEATYQDAVRNPPNSATGAFRVPDKKLRQLYKNNEVTPITVAQVLANRGAVNVTSFAVGLRTRSITSPSALMRRSRMDVPL